MLFKDITILDGDFEARPHRWVGVEGAFITYISDDAPADAARFSAASNPLYFPKP